MKKYFVLVLPFLSLFSLGCTPAYLPTSPHVPLFKEANSLKAGGGISPAGAETKLSYSISDNLFAAGGVAWIGRDTLTHLRNFFMEGGLGYYKYLEKPFKIPYIFFLNHIEFSAGYGKGRSFGSFDFTPSRYMPSVSAFGDYERAYLQLTLGQSSDINKSRFFNLNTGIDGAQIIRLSYVSFNNFSDQVYSRRKLDDLFIELFLLIRLKIELFEFEYSIGMNGSLQEKNNFRTHFLFLSLGASFNFSL